MFSLEGESKVVLFQEDRGRMDTKMRDRFQQRLSPQLFSSGKYQLQIIYYFLTTQDLLRWCIYGFKTFLKWIDNEARL